MAETHDTIDGLLAEFRGYSAGMPASYHVTMSWADFRRMLDRFDAAHDHDIAIATEASARAVVGACVKQQEAERKCVALREAVGYLCERMADMDATFDPSEVECLRAALATTSTENTQEDNK